MKNLFKHSLFTLLFCCFFLSCSKDDQLSGVAPVSSTSNSLDDCSQCTNLDLNKITGSESSPSLSLVGSVTVCQDANNIYITFITGNGEKLIKTQVGFLEDPTAINPSPKYAFDRDFLASDNISLSTMTVPLSDIAAVPGNVLNIFALATVQGNGQAWAGTLSFDLSGYPHSRYFTYTVKDCTTPPPTEDGCSFSLGYYFAKPNVEWPNSTLECPNGSVILGSNTYCKEVARDIFRTSNAKTGMTDAKMAFLQASAIKLSIASGKAVNLSWVDSTTGLSVAQALAFIDTFYTGKLATPANINTKSFNTGTTNLKNAAKTLDDYIQKFHCGAIVPIV
ncbi:hypothetical protein [Adhaeribacter rhizoryzae]|uniref:Uncharacterized protein n=1 Tax=Adhaeribacter rhizoryzae TaxID=2607907 RepID=A0A5M6DGN4_9BACT|nr:hypothetical protein [Adhaeribacter rhizoryzae]KAA5546671.1 hypothetical protein F0145_10015 [Adhaeribacter rhizoryzae]